MSLSVHVIQKKKGVDPEIVCSIIEKINHLHPHFPRFPLLFSSLFIAFLLFHHLPMSCSPQEQRLISVFETTLSVQQDVLSVSTEIPFKNERLHAMHDDT